MSDTQQTPEDMNALAKRIKDQIDAERAEAAERSKRRMGLGTTLRITGKTRPENISMDKKYRAVIYIREDEQCPT